MEGKSLSSHSFSLSNESEYNYFKGNNKKSYCQFFYINIDVVRSNFSLFSCYSVMIFQEYPYGGFIHDCVFAILSSGYFLFCQCNSIGRVTYCRYV